MWSLWWWAWPGKGLRPVLLDSQTRVLSFFLSNLELWAALCPNVTQGDGSLVTTIPSAHIKGHKVTNTEFYHEPPHPLLLDSFVFLLLFPLCVGVVRGHCLRELLNFACDWSVIFFEILGMLKNAVEVFLQGHTWDKTDYSTGVTLHSPRQNLKEACLKPRGHKPNNTVPQSA